METGKCPGCGAMVGKAQIMHRAGSRRVVDLKPVDGLWEVVYTNGEGEVLQPPRATYYREHDCPKGKEAK